MLINGKDSTQKDCVNSWEKGLIVFIYVTLEDKPMTLLSMFLDFSQNSTNSLVLKMLITDLLEIQPTLLILEHGTLALEVASNLIDLLGQIAIVVHIKM